MDLIGDPSVDREHNTLVVRVEGELDLATAPTLWTALEQALADGNQLVLDLSEVTFIDSSGLSVLIRAHQVLGPTGSLTVRSPNTQARRLFELAGIDSWISVEP
jgi:anti-sigma B factor antagonist